VIRLQLAGYLALALGVSAGLNVWQLYRAGKQADAVEHASQVCELNGQIAGLEATLDRGEAIAGLRAADTAELLSDLEQIAERGRQVRVEYRRAAAAAPLPVGCEPGKDRVDAVNTYLGPSR
jgi:hypothetical protein